MAGYLSVKMKRKDLEDVYDDFSDFSLSSPARKIRRLDAELPPIMEEEESGIPLDFDQPLPEEHPISVSVTEAVSAPPLNEERALVLYKPVHTPLLQSSSSPNYSISVNSDLIPGFKNQVFWSGHTNLFKKVDNEKESTDENTWSSNDCLAVVPWVKSQFPPASGVEELEMGSSEPMEAEVEDGSMEIEVNDAGVLEGQAQENGGLGGGEGLQQWQQQHCMTPQLPQNTSTPIMWSW